MIIKRGLEKSSPDSPGFSLIEIMVSFAIVALLLVTVYGLIIQSLKLTEENKMRLAASILADRKIELIRNLPYDDIGTVAGIPNGVIQDNEVIANSSGSFTVNTVIVYVDDSFDGVFPADLLNTDYKSARVRVSYTGLFGEKSVTAFSIIAPRAMESSPGGGTLVITVANADGQPVNLADVNIRNNSVSPAINITLQTATSGMVILPGAPASTEGYEITVTKAGYSTASTTARTTSNPNPTPQCLNLSVMNNQRTDGFYQIDLLSTLVIRAVAQNLPQNFRINTDAGTDEQTNPRLTLDSAGNIYVVWQDYRQGSAGKIYAQKYNSAGIKQWSSDKVIGSANNQILPDILVDSANNALYIAWNDNSNGNQDCFLVKINTSDGSDIWSGSKRVETGANNKDQTKPRIALASNSDLIIVWEDNRSGDADIYVRRYAPDQSTVWNEILVNSNSDTSAQSAPTLVPSADGNTYITWTDGRNGNQDIYGQKLSSTSTKLWTGDLLISSDAGTANQYYSNVAVDSQNNLFAVWTDERNGSLNQDVYIQKVASSSQTKLWGSSDLLVNTDGSTSTNQFNPSVAVDASDNVFVVWVDERYGNQDIFAQKIDANANRLWSPDLRVNVNTGTSDQTNPDLAINPATGKPYATWQDNRNANNDIYATEFDVYGTSTNLINLPISVVGGKKIGDGPPIIYKFNNNYTTDASGLVTLSNIEWDSYTITENSATYDIIMTNPPIPVSLNPNSSLEVILYLE